MKEYIIKLEDEIKEDGSQKVIGRAELVRCKDCKFYPNGDGATKWTPCREIIVPQCWFCADGEMKDNG